MTLKKVAVSVAIILLSVGSFFGGYILRGYEDEDITSLKFILEHYKKYYLEETDDYIGVMANSILDEYSSYYSKEEYELLNKVAKGSRAGTGIQTIGLTIVGVLGNSPAEKTGITVGGEIKSIKKPDGEEFIAVTNSKELTEIFSSISENENFTVKIDYDGEEREFTLKKEEYQETFVYYSDDSGSYRFNDIGDGVKFIKYSDEPKANFNGDTAYIYYKSFNGTSHDIKGSAEQIEVALRKFKENGKTKLIFDLRDNGGGYLDIACEIASHFINAKTGSKALVATSEDKNKQITEYYSKKVDYKDYGFVKIIFLANENTASASEVLMGAVFSYDTEKAVNLVLESSYLKGKKVYKTYGKGIMQTTFQNITGGDAIRLTTAYIKWPNGVCIHGVGLTKELLNEKCIEAEENDGDYALISALNIANNEV